MTVQDMIEQLVEAKEYKHRDDIYTLYAYTVHFAVYGRQIEAVRYFDRHGHPAQVSYPLRVIDSGTYHEIQHLMREKELAGYEVVFAERHLVFQSKEDWCAAYDAHKKRWSLWRKAILINYALTGDL